jgi:membrane protein implicated in regulation of membrane protease activity
VTASTVILIAVVVLVDIAVIWSIFNNKKRKKITGVDGILGMRGVVTETVAQSGKVLVNGELWTAKLDESSKGLLEVGSEVVVTGVGERLELRVVRVPSGAEP